MKILHVLPELKLAGAQIMVENLTIQLNKNGHDVRIISLYTIYTPITERLERENIHIDYLEKKSGFDYEVIIKLRQIIKDYNPDIIHTHSYVLKYVFAATRFLVKMKLPIVHTIHNLAEKETTSVNLRLEKFLFNNNIAHPVAISPLIKKSIIQYYGLANETVPMIYNGISLEKCIQKIDYQLNGQEVRIIHIGRFQEQKNHNTIVNAMKEVVSVYPETKLYLFGDGPMHDEIDELIKKNGLKKNIIMVGLTPAPYDEIFKSDIFILPSKWEGMPITLIEAMASGMPIVATPVGGVPDMINDGETGILCSDSVRGLANAIKELINDEELRRRLGQNAFRESKKFSAKDMAEEYEKFYYKLIKKT